MTSYDTYNDPLQRILKEHGARITELIGWRPDGAWRIDVLSPAFTKYTLGPVPGTDQWAMIHRFTGPDPDPRAHSHPCRFESYILQGEYKERLYDGGGYRDVWHPRGSHHVIEPDTIHRLLSVPGGECVTLCLAGPVVAQVRHYHEHELL